MMSRLIAKGIIRSYSMRQRQGRIAAIVKPHIGIVSNCAVCAGLMLMHSVTCTGAMLILLLQRGFGFFMNCSSLIKCIHATLHRIWTSWIGYSSVALFRAVATPLPTWNSSLCLIHWIFCGFIMTVLHIYYISWGNSLMDYLMNVRDHRHYVQLLVYKKF